MPKRTSKEDQGSLLIAVVGILAVLSMMAVTFGLAMRLESRASANLLSHYKMKILARGVLNYAISIIFKDTRDASTRYWNESGEIWDRFSNGNTLDLDHDGEKESEYVSDGYVLNADYAVRIEEAASMIYLNANDPKGGPANSQLVKMIENLETAVYGQDAGLDNIIVGQEKYHYSVESLNQELDGERIKLKHFLSAFGRHRKGPAVLNPNTIINSTKHYIIDAALHYNIINECGPEEVMTEAVNETYELYNFIHDKNNKLPYEDEEDIVQGILESITKTSGSYLIQNANEIQAKQVVASLCATYLHYSVNWNSGIPGSTINDLGTALEYYHTAPRSSKLVDWLAVKESVLYYDSDGDNVVDIDGDDTGDGDGTDKDYQGIASNAVCMLVPNSHIFKITILVRDEAGLFGDMELIAYVERKETKTDDNHNDYNDDVDILSVEWRD